jgi:hypothetical protein
MSISYFREPLYQLDVDSPGTFWVGAAIVIVQAEPFFSKHGLTYCTMLLVPDNNEIIRIRNIPLGYIDNFNPTKRLRRWSVVTKVPLRRTAHFQDVEMDSRIETFALDTEAIDNDASAFEVVLTNPYKQYQYSPQKQYSAEELAKKAEGAFARSVSKSAKDELRKLVVDNIGTLQSEGRSLGVLSPDRIELIAKSLNTLDKNEREKLASESRYFQSIILRVELFKDGKKLTSEPEKNPKFKPGSGMVVTAKFKVIDWGVVVAETRYLKDTHGIDIKLIEKSPQDIAKIYSEISKIDKEILKSGIKEHVYNSAHLDKYVPGNEDKILIMGANQRRYAVWYANSFI